VDAVRLPYIVHRRLNAKSLLGQLTRRFIGYADGQAFSYRFPRIQSPPVPRVL
jgi:hypothetical protein